MKQNMNVMDSWEIGSLIASACIQAGVSWQFLYIIIKKKSSGLSLISWYTYAVSLGFLCLFTIAKDQHWILIANYALATVLHTMTAIAAHKYKRT